MDNEQEPRKATDVVLSIEDKVNSLIDMIRSQDLLLKIFSNKLTDVLNRLDKQASAPQIVVETSHSHPKLPSSVPTVVKDPERNIKILSEATLPQTDAPLGFRRTSRPESYVNASNQALPPPTPPAEVKMPIQIPPMGGRPGMTVSSPPPGRDDMENINKAANLSSPTKKQNDTPSENNFVKNDAIPVIQRCVDRNSKAIFLADVEIVDMSSGQQVAKTRTNGNGKWQAALPIGEYQITIRKRESVSKEKVESVQKIQIDGKLSKVELPMVIIK